MKVAFARCVTGLLTLLLSSASYSQSDYMPYLVIDLAGGAAMPGNFLVGGEGGARDLLPSYDRLGWDPHTEDLFSEFGLPMAHQSSHILRGILSKIDPAVAKVQFASICNRSRDDSSRNPLSAIGLVNRRVSQQNFLYGTGLGSSSSLSGGRQASVRSDETTQPEHIGNHWTRDWLVAQSMDDSRMVEAFELDGDTEEEIVSQAATVYALVADLAPSGVIVLRGFDYHDGTPTLGDAADFRLGELLGAVTAVATAFQRPIFVHIITDGGMIASRNTRRWVGDWGAASLSVMGVLGPFSGRAFSQDQFGHYEASQKASVDTVFSQTPEAPALFTYSVWSRLNSGLR